MFHNAYSNQSISMWPGLMTTTNVIKPANYYSVSGLQTALQAHSFLNTTTNPTAAEAWIKSDRFRMTFYLNW